MSFNSRADATAKRERFWDVFDNVPVDMLTLGCEYCESGWAEGPGLVYRCDNCNPGQSGDPHTFSTTGDPVPDRPRGWWAMWLQPSSFFAKKKPPADPPCFGSRPGPQQRAENDCYSCKAFCRCISP